mmetsp:Transcript_17485/g.39479  ORF Transcript_17485/g.39479 Transcript_17485/m.39479 type:complete len:163 (+) Transcript_17485:2351-2839(+)
MGEHLVAIPIEEAMIKFIFAKSQIEAIDLIDILKMDVQPKDENNPENFSAPNDRLELFNKVIPEIIEEWTYKERRDFVKLCTGFDAIPFVIPKEESDDSNAFKITIEFNEIEEKSPDDLPIFHTCDNVMKIPFSAYEGNKQVFLSKLQISIDCVGIGGFDMG